MSPAENRVNGGHRPDYAQAVIGQTELTDQQRRSLADDGYLLVPSVLAADVVGRLATRLDDLVRATVDKWDATPGMRWEEAGVVRVRLDLGDPDFAACAQNPLLLHAADAVIGPGCEVDGLSLRAPLPGCGHQGLHPDFAPGHSTSGPSHPDEVKLIAPAGSLILFNSASLWHSGTLNYSPVPRLAVTAYLGPPAAQAGREPSK